MLDRRIKDNEATLAKAASGEDMLVLAVYGLSGESLAGHKALLDMIMAGWKDKTLRGTIVAVPRQSVADDIALAAMRGEIKPREVAEDARTMARMSKALAVVLRRQTEDLRAERRFTAAKLQAARQAGAKPTVKPGATTTTGGSKTSGYWRLKEGYPKTKTLQECPSLNQSHMRADLSAGDSSITVEWAALHGSTKAVTHSFTIQVDFAGLGKVNYDPGEETTFTLRGSWTYGTDGGGLNAAYPVLGYSGGVSVVSAEPRRGNRSAADCAQLWLGRVSGGDSLSDSREIKLKIPASGKEFTLDIGIANYGGPSLVTWVYEWVGK
jgi:hypothetical protein